MTGPSGSEGLWVNNFYDKSPTDLSKIAFSIISDLNKSIFHNGFIYLFYFRGQFVCFREGKDNH